MSENKPGRESFLEDIYIYDQIEIMQGRVESLKDKYYSEEEDGEEEDLRDGIRDLENEQKKEIEKQMDKE